MGHGGVNVRIEPPGLAIRLKRRLEQTAVAARMGEARKQLRIGLRTAQPLEQALHRIHSVALVHLDIGVQIVRQRKIGIELQRPLDRAAPLRQFLRRSFGKLAHQPARPPQTSPRGRVSGIQRDALLIQTDRFRKPAEYFARFIRAQVQIVGSRIGRRIVRELLPLARGQAAARATRRRR